MVVTLSETEQRKANAASVAFARFAITQLPKKAKLKETDFLPYQLQKDKGDKSGIPDKTRRLLKQLIKQRALPPRVEAAAIRDTGALNDG